MTAAPTSADPAAADHGGPADATGRAADRELLLARVRTRGDAVWELVRIRALYALVKGYEDEVRGWLTEQLLDTERREGTDAACRVRGAGRAHVTKATMRWVASSPDALAAWAAQHRPDEVTSRLRVDAPRVDVWLNQAGADAAERARRAGALRELLGDPRAVREERRVAEDLPARLADDPAFARTDDGHLADQASGELLPVRQVAASARTFAFTPDRGVVGQLVEQLRERVLLALPAPSTEEPA